jgi:hypothetical protein
MGHQVLRETILFLLGLALLAGGMYLIHTKVLAIKVGEHTSRLVGTLCAILAYYYLRHSFSLRMPTGVWTLHKVLETAKVWLPPVGLFGLAGYYAITIFRNWRSEFIELIQSSVWIVVVAALVLGARYLMAL